jgi:M6 family metalloprotease-like protein
VNIGDVMAEQKGQGRWIKFVLVLMVGLLICSLLPVEDDTDILFYEYDSTELRQETLLNPEEFGLYDGYIPYLPDPAPKTLIQPDGTEFTGKMKGDILGGHMETLEGYSVIENKRGFWTYAQQDEKGILVPTNNIVGKINPQDIPYLERYLANAPPVIRDNTIYDKLRGTRAPPTFGTTNAIAIMLNFSNRDFNPLNDNAHFAQMLNGTTGNTMRTFYQEVSYGTFDIEVDVVGPFESSRTMEYYGEDGSGRDNKNGPVSEMAREAVSLADAAGVNFTKYDMDSDNRIDALFIIHAGSGQEDGGPSSEIWSHQGLIFPAEPTDDGISANVYSTEPEDGKIGVFCHEFGHVLDLPDLYDADYGGSGGQSYGIGDWGLMGGGSWNGGGNSPAHPSAWSRIFVGWVEPQIVTSDISLSSIVVPPVENYPVVYKLWAHDPSENTSEYFLVENRQKLGFDSALPGEGILIWHIDDTYGNINWNNVNDNPNKLRVDLEEAHGGTQHLEAYTNQGDANDPWVGIMVNFTTTSDPDSDSHNGSATEAWVWNISDILPDNNMTIGFNEINTGPTGIFIEDPTSSVLILPVYDFILNDTEFPDEDVATFPGNLKLQHSWPGMGVWVDTPFQTLINWTPGVGGVINCTGLPNGTWDFRVKATDEEGHIWYTNILTDVMILDLAPPFADAGPNFTVGTDIPALLDGSNSSDDSGFISWYNWTFGDGDFLNGFGPANATITHEYTTPGVYTVILNVSDAQSNWAIDTAEVTVFDATPPETNLTMGAPKYRANISHDWNITKDTTFSLSANDKFSGVNLVWYKIDSDYFEYLVPFDLQGYSEGSHIITWGALDGVGNNDTGQVITVWVDVSAPTTDYLIDDPKHPKASIDGVNVTSNTTIFLVPTDNPSHGSGVILTWFYIDSDYYEGLNFTLNAYGEGGHIVVAGSLDNLGHNATGYVVQIWVDDSPPVTSIVIDNPKHPQAAIDGCNVSNSTTINLIGLDQPSHDSGVNFTWYFIDSDYYVGTSFNLTGYGEGYHNITWGSEDFLFHNETASKIMIWVDETPPDTHLSVWDPHHPLVPYDGGNITSKTQITLSSVDHPTNHSAGVDFSWYTIDGDLYKGTSFNLSLYPEGPHTVTWGSQDYLGHNETGNVYTLWVDDTPPQTVLTIGPDKFPINNDEGCNVTASSEFLFTSTDYPAHNSSVRYEWFTMNGTWYIGNNFTLSDFGFDEGQYVVTWGSIDWLGNNETGNTITVNLDRRAPNIDIIVGEPSHREFAYEILNVTEETLFSLDLSDPYSGVAFGWYIIDGGYFEGTSFNLSGYGVGIHQITYGAQDNLSHNKTQETFDVFIDLTPPNSSLVIDHPRYRVSPLDFWTVTGKTPFSITSEDASSGVDKIWYIIDGIYYEEKYDIGFSFSLVSATEGLQTVIWGAKDHLGNNMTGTSTTVWADINSPVTNISVSQPSYREGDTHTWNVTSTTSFELTGSDAISGMNFSWYEIDGELFLGNSFNLDELTPGDHFISWGSMDLIGNNETGNFMVVVLDDLPPSTLLDVDEPRYRNLVADYWNVTSGSVFTLLSQDQYSGINFVWYTIDGIVYSGSQFTLEGLDQGVHNITWGSEDNLGNNETQNQIFVVLDDTAPETQIVLDDPKYKGNEEHIWNVTLTTVFNLVSDDENSQVDLIWYTIDGTYYEDDHFRLLGRLDGIHEITWGASDNLGNVEETHTMTFNLDTLYPETTIIIGNETLDLSERFKMNSSSIITIYAEEGMGSGIDFIWYTIDGGSTYLIYEGPFTIPNTTTTINFGAKDLIGNNATGTTLRVNVDDSPPVIVIDDEPDDESEEKPFAEELANFLSANYMFIMIALVVLIIIAVLLSMRKRKDKDVDFQVEESAEPVVAMEVVKEVPEVEFEEEAPIIRQPPPPPPPPPPK